MIFCTLSVSSSYVVRRTFNYHPVHSLIIDEAAQAVECETLLPLASRPKRMLLVGDPQQLCATVQSKCTAAAGFTRSLMQRLMVDCGQPHGFLDTQYRMHPSIAEFPVATFYAGRLKTDASLLQQQGFFQFVDVQGRQAGGGNTSLCNKEEAVAIAAALGHLLSTGVASSHGELRVLTFVSSSSAYAHVYRCVRARACWRAVLAAPPLSLTTVLTALLPCQHFLVIYNMSPPIGFPTIGSALIGSVPMAPRPHTPKQYYRHGPRLPR